MGLHSDFAYFGGSDYEDGFGETGEEACGEGYGWRGRGCGESIVRIVPPPEDISVPKFEDVICNVQCHHERATLK